MILKLTSVKDNSFRVAITSFMEPHVKTIILKAHKHMRSVVIPFADVMSNLFRLKIPAYCFLYNKTMFTDISSLVAKRMQRAINKNISALFYTSTFPRCGFFTTQSNFANVYTGPRAIIFWFNSRKFDNKLFVTSLANNGCSSLFFKIRLVSFIKTSTFKRTSFSSSYFDMAIRSFKFFFTDRANSNYRHNILQIKRTAFGVLTRIWLNILHLRLSLFEHKKSILLLDNTNIAYKLNFVKGKI